MPLCRGRKTKEAYELLLHTVSLGGLDEPDSAVSYGLGRLAEQYGDGLRPAAYRHVTNEEEDQDLPMSTWSLAEKRIRALEAEMAAGKDAKCRACPSSRRGPFYCSDRLLKIS